VAPLSPAIALGVMHWTGGAGVSADNSGDVYDFVTLLRGQGRMTVAGREVEHVPGKCAVVVAPERPSRAVTDHAITALCVRVDRSLIETHFHALTGIEPSGGIEFDADMPLAGEAASIWRFVDHVVDEIGRDASVLRNPLVMERISDALLTGLLFARRHNRSELLRKANRNAGPHYVRQAEEFIEAHCQEQIDSQRIAEATGVSLSSLYEGFRRFRRYTPMKFLKLVRLRRARDELLLASPECTITRIAAKWGFLHMGRFSNDYAQMFGEKPTDTLRRSRFTSGLD
jgi:AraC-like DNA-binding protein